MGSLGRFYRILEQVVRVIYYLFEAITIGLRIACSKFFPSVSSASLRRLTMGIYKKVRPKIIRMVLKQNRKQELYSSPFCDAIEWLLFLNALLNVSG